MGKKKEINKSRTQDQNQRFQGGWFENSTKKKKKNKKPFSPFSFFLIFFFVSPFNGKKIYTTREKYNRLGPNNTPVDFEMRRNNARTGRSGLWHAKRSIGHLPNRMMHTITKILRAKRKQVHRFCFLVQLSFFFNRRSKWTPTFVPYCIIFRSDENGRS